MYDLYPFTICYTQLFTRGNLAGLTYSGRLGFCSEADCHNWAKAVTTGQHTNYIIVGYWVDTKAKDQ